MPCVAFREDGVFLLFWERDEHYLEVETRPDAAPVEVFYRNRETGFYEGHDWNAGAGELLPDTFCRRFTLFCTVRF